MSRITLLVTLVTVCLPPLTFCWRQAVERSTAVLWSGGYLLYLTSKSNTVLCSTDHPILCSFLKPIYILFLVQNFVTNQPFSILNRWLFACATAQKIVPVSSFLIQSGKAEQTPAQTASNTTTTASKPRSNSDMGMDTSSRSCSDSDVRMETGNEEQKEPSDNHPLSSVVLCFNKKLAAQESKPSNY